MTQYDPFSFSNNDSNKNNDHKVNLFSEFDPKPKGGVAATGVDPIMGHLNLMR